MRDRRVQGRRSVRLRPGPPGSGPVGSGSVLVRSVFRSVRLGLGLPGSGLANVGPAPR